MTRLVDLDDIAGLERAWAELQHLYAVRTADPELREAILARLDGLDAPLAEAIRMALDRFQPAVVLDGFVDWLTPDIKTVGFYRRCRALEAAA